MVDEIGHTGCMVLNLIAWLVVIVTIVAVLGHAAYLALLGAAANKRADGASVTTYVRSRWQVTALTIAGALLAALLATGGAFADVLAILIGAASTGSATKALESTRKRYRSEG